MQDDTAGQGMSEIGLLGLARCEFAHGVVADLWVTELKPFGLTCLHLDPPPTGTRLKVVLSMLARPDLPPVEAFIADRMFDPNCPELCGFQAYFVKPEAKVFDAINRAIETQRPTHYLRPVPGKRLPEERRRYPRLCTPIQGAVSHYAQRSHARVRNISMGGALLAFELGPDQPRLVVGDTITIAFSEGGKDPPVAVQAQVIRVQEQGTTALLAVKFDLDDRSRVALAAMLSYLMVAPEPP